MTGYPLNGNQIKRKKRFSDGEALETDSLGCITGSIAEAFFGIPKNLYDKGLEYLPPHFKDVVREFEEKYGNKFCTDF